MNRIQPKSLNTPQWRKQEPACQVGQPLRFQGETNPPTRQPTTGTLSRLRRSAFAATMIAPAVMNIIGGLALVGSHFMPTSHKAAPGVAKLERTDNKTAAVTDALKKAGYQQVTAWKLIDQLNKNDLKQLGLLLTGLAVSLGALPKFFAGIKEDKPGMILSIVLKLTASALITQGNLDIGIAMLMLAKMVLYRSTNDVNRFDMNPIKGHMKDLFSMNPEKSRLESTKQSAIQVKDMTTHELEAYADLFKRAATGQISIFKKEGVHDSSVLMMMVGSTLIMVGHATTLGTLGAFMAGLGNLGVMSPIWESHLGKKGLIAMGVQIGVPMTGLGLMGSEVHFGPADIASLSKYAYFLGHGISIDPFFARKALKEHAKTTPS
jgi:hypothetical protein